MIRVTMNLHSAISPSRDGELGVVEIRNLGTGTKARGNYSYVIYGKRGKKMHEGTIFDFPRTRKLTVDLLARVVTDARGVQ